MSYNIRTHNRCYFIDCVSSLVLLGVRHSETVYPAPQIETHPAVASGGLFDKHISVSYQMFSPNFFFATWYSVTKFCMIAALATQNR